MKSQLFTNTHLKKIIGIFLALLMLIAPVAFASDTKINAQDTAVLGNSEKPFSSESLDDQNPSLGLSEDNSDEILDTTPPLIQSLALPAPYEAGTYPMGKFVISQITAKEVFGVFQAGDGSSGDGRPLPIKTDREYLWINTAEQIKSRRTGWYGGYGATFHLHDSLLDATTVNNKPLDSIAPGQAHYHYEMPGYVGTSFDTISLGSDFVNKDLPSGLYSVEIFKYEKKVSSGIGGNKDKGDRDSFWVLIWWDPDGELGVQANLEFKGGYQQDSNTYNPDSVVASHTFIEGLPISSQKYEIKILNENLSGGSFELYSATTSGNSPVTLDLSDFYSLGIMPDKYTVEFTVTLYDSWNREYKSVVTKDFMYYKEPTLNVRALNPTGITVDRVSSTSSCSWKIINPVNNNVLFSGSGDQIPTTTFASLSAGSDPTISIPYRVVITEQFSPTLSSTVQKDFAIKSPLPTHFIDRQDNPSVIKGIRDPELEALNEPYTFYWNITKAGTTDVVASCNDNIGKIDFSTINLPAGNYVANISEFFSPYAGFSSGLGSITVPFYIGTLEMSFPDLNFGTKQVSGTNESHPLNETATLSIIDNRPASANAWALTAKLDTLTTSDNTKTISPDAVHYVENGNSIPFNQVSEFASGTPKGSSLDLSKVWLAQDKENGFLFQVDPAALTGDYSSTITWSVKFVPIP